MTSNKSAQAVVSSKDNFKSGIYNLWCDRRRRLMRLDDTERRSGFERRRRNEDIDRDFRGSKSKDFLNRSGKIHMALLISADVLALITSFIFSILLTGYLNYPGNYDAFLYLLSNWWNIIGIMRMPLFSAMMLLTVIILWSKGHYTRRRPIWDEHYELLKIIVFITALDGAIMFLGDFEFPRTSFLLTWLLALFLIPSVRTLVKYCLIIKGAWMRPTIIIGTGKNARNTATVLASETLLGFNVLGFLEPPKSLLGREYIDKHLLPSAIDINGRLIPVHKMGSEPEGIISGLGNPHIVVALDGENMWEISKLLFESDLPYSSFNIVPTMRGIPLIGMETMHFYKQDLLMLRIRNNLARKIPQYIKRIFDIITSSILLVALSPLFLVIMIMIRNTGPIIFFGHPRIGQDKKTFLCYKFRSMVPNSQEVLQKILETDPEARKEWERNFKLKNDPRITPIGKLLRGTSLDELPQLWNVLKGEMSLVGPRPIIAEELERYEDKQIYYLETKPGITGLWQISGRNDISYEDRVKLDVWYSRNWQLWYDIVILIKTIGVIFHKKGAY